MKTLQEELKKVNIDNKQTNTKGQNTLKKASKNTKNSSKNLFYNPKDETNILENITSLNTEVNAANIVPKEFSNNITNESVKLIDNQISLGKISDRAFIATENKPIDWSKAKQPTPTPDLNQVLDKNYKNPEIQGKGNIGRSFSNPKKPIKSGKTDNINHKLTISAPETEFEKHLRFIDEGVERNAQRLVDNTQNEVIKTYGDKVEDGVRWFNENSSSTVNDLNSIEAKAARVPKDERLKAVYEKTGLVESPDKKYYDGLAKGEAIDLDIDNYIAEQDSPKRSTMNAENALAEQDSLKRSTMSVEDALAYDNAVLTDNRRKVAPIVKRERIDMKVNSMGQHTYDKVSVYDEMNKGTKVLDTEKLDLKPPSFELNDVEFPGGKNSDGKHLFSSKEESIVKQNASDDLKNNFFGRKNTYYGDPKTGAIVARGKAPNYARAVSQEGFKEAADMSKKMSGFKTLGKMAIGGALMYGLISALSDSGGQQSNAQLYGQQPLY